MRHVTIRIPVSPLVAMVARALHPGRHWTRFKLATIDPMAPELPALVTRLRELEGR